MTQSGWDIGTRDCTVMSVFDAARQEYHLLYESFPMPSREWTFYRPGLLRRIIRNKNRKLKPDYTVKHGKAYQWLHGKWMYCPKFYLPTKEAQCSK